MQDSVHVVLAAAALLVAPVHAFDLEGTWNAASMCVPSELVPEAGAGGVLTELHFTDHFAVFSGQITVTGGTFAGHFDGPWSGSVSVSPGGVVTVVDDEAQTISYVLNSSSNFMVGLEPDPGSFQEIELWVKQPATTVLSDIAGEWNLVAMCTPSVLIKTFDGGFLTGLTRGDHFEVVKGLLTVTGNNFTAFFPGEGSSGGTVAITSPGIVRATPDGEPAFDLFLNASKDVMVATLVESDFHELLVLLKVPAGVSQHDLQGRWPFVSYNTPSAVSLQTNEMGEAIGVNGGMNFEAGAGFLQIDSGGNAFGSFGPGESFTGTVLVGGSPGQLAVDFAGDPPFTACVNPNLDVFAAVNPDGSFNELLVGVRSIKPFGPEVRPGPGANQVTIRWVGTPARQLQELTATSPLTWTDVPGTLGQNSSILSRGADPAFFRVVEN